MSEGADHRRAGTTMVFSTLWRYIFAKTLGAGSAARRHHAAFGNVHQTQRPKRHG